MKDFGNANKVKSAWNDTEDNNRRINRSKKEIKSAENDDGKRYRGKIKRTVKWPGNKKLK